MNGGIGINFSNMKLRDKIKFWIAITIALLGGHTKTTVPEIYIFKEYE